MKYFLFAIFVIYITDIQAQTNAKLKIETENSNFIVLVDNTKMEIEEEDGAYIILNIPAGKHTVVFKKKHFNSISKSFKFKADGEIFFELERMQLSDKFLLETVDVEGGNFIMGNNSFGNLAKPHKVTLNSFKIMKNEVTIEDFIVFMNEIHIDFNGNMDGVKYIELYEGAPIIQNDMQEFVFQANDIFLNPNFPVSYVTYAGAKAFAEWSGGRLPSEAEWEYAAQGGKKNSGNIYSGSNFCDIVAWNQNNSNDIFHEVALLQANDLGIYDMSGNVAEWCNDWYSDTYYMENENINPIGPKNGEYKIVRGGSAFDEGWLLEVSGRHYASVDQISVSIGFRVAFDGISSSKK